MGENAKNEYELKKQEREQAREQNRRQARREKTKKSLTRYIFWIFIILLVGYGIFLLVRTTAPQGEDFSIEYEVQGREHIAEGSTHPPYNSNPPSSGWHYATPASGGFYNAPLPDEQVVHNLEHGDIWIAYHPNISDEAKSTLESFAGRFVVVSPRSENEGDISLVAWGRVDTFNLENGIVNPSRQGLDEADEERIEDFIKRYDNRGPEKVRSVQGGPGGF